MQSTHSPRDVHRILIVDDAPAVRESLRWLLDDEPWLTVIGAAASGSEAIQMTVNLKPDLILLDIELPDMDGFTVTKQIKAMLLGNAGRATTAVAPFAKPAGCVTERFEGRRNR